MRVDALAARPDMGRKTPNFIVRFNVAFAQNLTPRVLRNSMPTFERRQAGPD
jgi:hypothetical protein